MPPPSSLPGPEAYRAPAGILGKGEGHYRDMWAGLRIVTDVVSYRLRRLEMANLAAAASIAIVLRLPAPDVLARVAFAFLLNILVYLNNDYVDVEIDLRSLDKDRIKSQYLAANRRAALSAQWLLVGLLGAFAAGYDVGLFVPLIAGGGVCVWYSARLKHEPFLDILAMMVWGVTMPLVGSPIDSTDGWALALQLGLFSGVFESIQVMRDADGDAEGGLRTTGVVLGKQRTLWLARLLMVACTAYALLVMMQPLAAGVSLLALLVPFAGDRIARYWTRVKLVYGVAWLLICGTVFLGAAGGDLPWSIDLSARWP
jgi:4-hydroxybenzoate polyprenyltransferase